MIFALRINLAVNTRTENVPGTRALIWTEDGLSFVPLRNCSVNAFERIQKHHFKSGFSHVSVKRENIF